MALTPEEQKRVDELRAKEQGVEIIPFGEEEGKSLREDYLTEYNKALQKLGFKSTIARKEPTEAQKSIAQNNALDALSKKYRETAAGKEPTRKEGLENIPWAPGKGPSLKFPPVKDVTEAREELRMLEGKTPTVDMGEALPGGYRRTISPADQRALSVYSQLGMAKDTEANKQALEERKATVKDLLDKSQKYSKENIRNFIMYGQAQPSKEEPSKEPDTADTEKPADKGAASDAAPTTTATTETPATTPKAETTTEPAKGETAGDIKEKFTDTEQTASDISNYMEGLNLSDAEKRYFQGVENRLTSKLETAKRAYREGADNIMLMKALEKIAEGIALWGAGAYGKKHGVDAVSGLKFSPSDWSEQMKALEKELDIAESQYTKGTTALESEKERLQRFKEKALEREDVIKKATEKAQKEQEDRLSGASEAAIKDAIKQTDDRLDSIDKGLAILGDKKFGDLDPAQQEAQLLSVATTVGIPVENLRKEKGVLFWRDMKFDPETARTALLAQKSQLQSARVGQQNALFGVKSGQAVPTGTAAGAGSTEDTIKVMATDKKTGKKTKGKIPRSQFSKFKQENPDAEIINE